MRFRLRSLLIITMLVAIMLGLVVNRARQISIYRQRIQDVGGELVLESQVDYSMGGLGPRPSDDNKAPANAIGFAQLMPDDIWRIDFNRPQRWDGVCQPPLVTEEVLLNLQKAGSVNEINIFSAKNLTDRAFSNFGSLSNLTSLYIEVDGGSVTDNGVAYICLAPRLEELEINGAALTSESLGHLKNSSVSSLMLVDCDIDNSELKQLARENPELEVWISGRVYRVPDAHGAAREPDWAASIRFARHSFHSAAYPGRSHSDHCTYRPGSKT